MPPKQRASKRSTQKNPASAPALPAADNVLAPNAQQIRPVADADAYRPKATYIPALFFAGSIIVRSILFPYYEAAYTLGIVGRPNYPSAYTPAGVTCSVQALDGPQFCEHELLFEDEGFAILSCDANRPNWNTVMGPLKDPDPRGQMWMYDYTKSKTSTKLELVGFPENVDFHPLGITTFSDAMKTSLFVINHQRTGPSIEVFTLESSSLRKSHALQHERTVPASPEIKSANSLVAIDHEHLYVTNDHSWTILEQGKTWSTVETYLGPIYGLGWTSYVDISSEVPSFQNALPGVPFPNGIAKGAGDTIYIASSSLGTVGVFQPRNESTPLLKKVSQIEYGHVLDNIHVFRHPKTGLDTVLSGGHPSLRALQKRAADPYSSANVAPSWITMAKSTLDPAGDEDKDGKEGKKSKSKVEVRKGDGWYEPKGNHYRDLRTVYQDDGHHFSSATGAAIDLKHDVLLAPGLYETGILVCTGVKGALLA